MGKPLELQPFRWIGRIGVFEYKKRSSKELREIMKQPVLAALLKQLGQHYPGALEHFRNFC